MDEPAIHLLLNIIEPNCSHFGGLAHSLESFYYNYETVHGYLGCVICCLGILAGVCNAFVLSRPHMRSAANTFLTAIAISDCCLMLSYLIYLLHFRLTEFTCVSDRDTYAWALFEAFHANFSVTAHSISLWLAVCMAALRNYILAQPHLRKRMNEDVTVALKLVAMTIGCVMLLAVPIYMTNSVVETHKISERTQNLLAQENCSVLIYYVEPSDLARKSDHFLLKFSFWQTGIAFKVLPCAFLCIYIGKLLKIFKDTCQRRRVNLGRIPDNVTNPSTVLLVVILFVTLIFELPQALISVSVGLYPDDVDCFYRNVADLFDLFSLVQCLSTFVLYCSMSHLYRQTIAAIFRTGINVPLREATLIPLLTIRNGGNENLIISPLYEAVNGQNFEEKLCRSSLAPQI